MFEIVSSDGIGFDDCCRLLLSSDPWLKLGYGETEVRQISESSRLGNVLLAVQSGRTIGAAITRPGFLLGEYLKILVVEKEERSRGIGRALMGAFEQSAFSRTPNTYLCVSSFNLKAREFYLSLGYVDVGTLPELLVQGENEILMRKTLGPYQGWIPYR